MIKSFLKKMLSPRLLKSLFLVYNKIKISTFDKAFFPALPLAENDFDIYKIKNPFLEVNPPIASFSEEVQNKLKIWLDPAWIQDEYLLNFNRPGLIDPVTGWAMTIDKKLIYPSLGFASAPHVRKPDFFSSLSAQKKTIDLSAIISLRDTGEENYFHFFNDVLAKVFFIRDQGFNLSSYTFIISKRLSEKDYFKEILRTSWLQNLTWYVQPDDTWVKFDKALFCKPFTHTKKYLTEVSSFFGTLARTNKGRRIFLSRSRQSMRYVENFEALNPILLRFGFEVIDTANMAFLDQIKLFNECRTLIAVHGAGLTNMIFRQEQPMSILEIIHPFPYIPFHYMMLARQFGYSYTPLLGKESGTAGAGGFMVDPVVFETAIGQLIQTEHDNFSRRK